MYCIRFLSVILATLVISASYAETTVNSNTVPPANGLPLSTKLKLDRSSNRLYAHVLVQQPEDKQGKFVVEWIPPDHTICSKSTYTLDYRGKTFHTRAYRTLAHAISGKNFVCKGVWHVKLNDLNGLQLAKAKVTVSE